MRVLASVEEDLPNGKWFSVTVQLQDREAQQAASKSVSAAFYLPNTQHYPGRVAILQTDGFDGPIKISLYAEAFEGVVDSPAQAQRWVVARLRTHLL